MKKNRKLRIIGILTLVICFAIVGCGKIIESENENETVIEESELPEYTYVADYEKIETDDYLGQVLFLEDGLVYINSSYDEETWISTYEICKYDFETKTTITLPLDLVENEYVSQMFLDQNNQVIIITQNDDYTTEIPVTQFFINKMNAETNEITKIEITDELQSESEYIYLQFVASDSKGKIYLANGDSSIWVLNEEYKLENTITLPSYISAIMISENDELLISTYNDNGNNIIQKYDNNTNTFDKGQQIDFYFYNTDSMVSGPNQDFLIKTDTGILEYSYEDNNSIELVNFINSDINGDYIQKFKILEDGRILLFSQDWNTDPAKYELVYLTKTKTSELPERELISFKTLYLSYDIKSRIIEFNKTNQKYRITVETYDLVDYEAGLAKYQADLVTGNASDIIDLGNANIKQLANKGILEDLYPYIEADTELDKDDFFTNVLDAYSVNGELYAVVPSVYLMTMIGKTKFVGEEPGWRPADIEKLAKSLPEDVKLLEYGSQKEVLNMLVTYDLNSYINWETGECNFASDDFVSLMEFAKGFPTEEDIQLMYENEYSYDMMNSEDKIAMDQIILVQGYFSSLLDYQYTMARFNEPAICIGFPCIEGSGTFLGSAGNTLGLNANSNKKEGAWEFIRYFLTEETSENSWGIPVNKNAYDQMIKENMTPTYFENEEDIYVPEEQRKISEDGRVEMPINTFYRESGEVYIYGATQEDADTFKKLFESTNLLSTYDTAILNIIQEEMDSYFSGQKNAEAVADIIQSRLQIYVNENR